MSTDPRSLLDATQYEERFRIMGQWLDSMSAETSVIELEGHQFVIHAQKAGQALDTWFFTAVDFEHRTAEARHLRSRGLGQAAGEWAVILRTLGQVLSAPDIKITRLELERNGVRVQGTVERTYFNEWYAHDVLADEDAARRIPRALDALRADTRSAPHTQQPPFWQRWFKGRTR